MENGKTDLARSRIQWSPSLSLLQRLLNVAIHSSSAFHRQSSTHTVPERERERERGVIRSLYSLISIRKSKLELLNSTLEQKSVWAWCIRTWPSPLGGLFTNEPQPKHLWFARWSILAFLVFSLPIQFFLFFYYSYVWKTGEIIQQRRS